MTQAGWPERTDCQLGGGGGHGALKHGYNSPVRTNQRGGLLTACHANPNPSLFFARHMVEDFDPMIFTVEPFVSELTHWDQFMLPEVVA